MGILSRKFFFIVFLFVAGGLVFAQDTCSVSIDSVWFSEETDCNDSNIVEICYILSSDCPDSEFTVSVSMNADSGLTWVSAGEGWFSTLTDTAGDLGAAVDTGLHCFNWIMNEDTTAEGREWEVEVGVGWAVALIDSFSTLDTTIYQINGNDGYLDSDSGYFVLTQNAHYRNGRLIFNELFLLDTMTIEFDFKMLAGSCTDTTGLDSTGGDGICLIFSHTINPTLATGHQLGVRNTGGWGIEFDNLNNDCCDSSGNHTALTIDQNCSDPSSCTFYDQPLALAYSEITNELVDSNWHHVVVGWNYPHCSMQFDGDVLIDGDFPSLIPFEGYIGLSASTGACYSEQIIDNFSIYTNSTGIFEIADTATAPLDSRSPEVHLLCPGDSVVSAGDIVHLEWSVVDTFWNDDPCSLHIYGIGCLYDTTIIVPDTSYDWVVPSAATGCDTVWFVVTARDSFCNWGSDSCAMMIEEACSVSIDSVWFSEETDCNDSNIVQICYILSSTCPESLFNVSVRMSGDGGETWTVPLDSLWDAEGDIGEGVLPDTHCFFWEMGYDLPDTEGYDWMVKVEVPIVAETFEILDSTATHGYNGTGLAFDGEYYWSYEQNTGRIYKYAYLTGIPIDTIYIGAWYNTDLAYIDSCLYYGRTGTYPHDVYRYNLRTSTTELVCDGCCNGVGAQGLATDGDYLFVTTGLAATQNIIRIDISSYPTLTIDTIITVLADTLCCDGIAYTGEGPCGGIWGVNDRGYMVQYSLETGLLQSIHRVPRAPFGSTGVEGLCYDGEYLWYVDTDLDKMYQIDFCTSEDLFYSAIAPLDSRPPSVHLLCPGDSAISAGDIVHLEWSVIDTFWNDDPCSLHIYGIGCSYDTTIIVPDTFYDWVVPSAAAECDTLWFVVSARDSFCNWGSDSCAIPPVCRPIEAQILCAPCGGFTGCYNQTVLWQFTDLNSINIDTSRTYFSVLINHASGTADTIHLTGDSDSLSFECVPSPPECYQVEVTLSGFEFESGDSVWVTIDSLYNEAGCLTIPE
ncbi:hypothetical protein J7L68_04720 [bacterium]|nr:hypothetical protein [bacterium]